MSQNLSFKEIVTAVNGAKSVFATCADGFTVCYGDYKYVMRFGNYRPCVNDNVFVGFMHKILSVVNPLIWADVMKYDASEESYIDSDCFCGPKALLLQFHASRSMCKY